MKKISSRVYFSKTAISVPGASGIMEAIGEVAHLKGSASGETFGFITKFFQDSTKADEAVAALKSLDPEEANSVIKELEKRRIRIPNEIFKASGISKKLMESFSRAEELIGRDPAKFIAWFENPANAELAGRIRASWKSHPEHGATDILDFAKSKIKPTAAPAGVETGRVAVIGDAISDAERRVAEAAAEIIFDPSGAGRSFEEMKKIVAESSSSPELRQALIKTLTDFRNPRQEAAFKALLESKGIKIPDDIIAEASRIRGGVPVSSPVVLTPVGEVVSDAGGAITKADEAAAAGTKADEALTSGRAAAGEAAAEGAARTTGNVKLTVIGKSDDVKSALEKLRNREFELYPLEIENLERIAQNSPEEFLAAILTEEKEGGAIFEYIRRYGKGGLATPIIEATGKINAEALAKAVREVPAASPAAKAINWRRAAKIAGGVAAGLTGIALISYILADNEEEEEEINKALSSTGVPEGGDSSLPQGGTGDSDYETASRIMMEKGYLSSPQSSWTKEFDSAFRSYIDAATKNGKGLPKTNLVGGQSWVDVAPSLGFTPDKAGALSAVSVLAKFIPSGKTSPTTTTPTTPEGGKVDQTGSGAGTASPKVQVLADIISRLYNDRLVEGGGGIFSRELKQAQSFVDAVGGASPGGYINAAKVLLSRNPNLERLLPEQTIGDVLSKRTVKSHPAYNAIKESQKSIHQLFEAANPGIINPRRRRATENVKEYLGSAAGGNWKQAGNLGEKMISKRGGLSNSGSLKKEALAPVAIGIGLGVLAAGAWAYNYFSDYGNIAKKYPDLSKRTELDILYRFKKELDNLWFNSDHAGVLAYDAYAYFLGFNYGYDENKLVEKLKEIGVDFGDESFEEMMNDDEDGSYYSVVHHLNKGRADRAEADKGVAAAGGAEAVVGKTEGTAQAKTGYVQLVGAPGTVKIEKLGNGEEFIYTIKSPTEFSYVWNYSDGRKKKGKDSVTTENFSSKWNEAAETINQLPVTNNAMEKSSSYRNRFVKTAAERKMRIKQEVLESLTPAERATMRRLRMRGA